MKTIINIFHHFILFFLIFFVSPFQYLSSQTVDNDNAEIINQIYSAQMFAGNEYQVIIRLKNTGSSIWTPEYYTLRQISSANTYENMWNVTDVNLSSNVYPGAIATFSFFIKAPDKPGRYEFKWGMCARGIYFGQQTDSEFVTVAGPPITEKASGDASASVLNNASLLNMIMTDTMTAGMNYQVTVTMQNNGQSVWRSSEGYRLSFVDSLMNTDKGISKYEDIELSHDVMPGEQVSYIFNVTAPPAPGLYNFAWVMKQGNSPFGETTYLISVDVRNRAGDLKK